MVSGALGLYHYNEEHRLWVRVLADFAGENRAFVGRYRGTGLFALLLDTAAPPFLTGITATADGRIATISGNAEPLATIQLFSGAQYLGSFPATIQGRYSFTVALPVGRHALTLRQVDQAGNLSVQSIDFSVTTDWKVNIQIVPNSNQAIANNQLLVLDVPPRIINGRTMVPLRFVAEALGANVLWDAATNAVNITLGETRVSLTIGSPTATVNGQTVLLDVAPLVERGRTLVPVRFLSEAFGYEVVWHSVSNRIEIRK